MAKCYTVSLSPSSKISEYITRPLCTNLFNLSDCHTGSPSQALMGVCTNVYWSNDSTVREEKLIYRASVQCSCGTTLGEYKLTCPQQGDNWAIVMVEGENTALAASNNVFLLAAGSLGSIYHMGPESFMTIIQGKPQKAGLMRRLGLKKAAPKPTYQVNYLNGQLCLN